MKSLFLVKVDEDKAVISYPKNPAESKTILREKEISLLRLLEIVIDDIESLDERFDGRFRYNVVSISFLPNTISNEDTYLVLAEVI